MGQTTKPPSRASAAASVVAASDAAVAAAGAASRDSIPTHLHDERIEVIAALLGNPALEPEHVSILLERKDLPAAILDSIAKKKVWSANAAVRRKLAAHPHTPRRISTRLLRELYLLDLIQLTLQPAVAADLRRLAEEMILARIGQLPLGQKRMVARRGSARVAGALLIDANLGVVSLALDNPFLTESQILKTLARASLPAENVAEIARHAKWSSHVTVRLALVRHPRAPLERILAFLPELTLGDLEDLFSLAQLPANLRQYLQHELARRSRGPSALQSPADS
jgi:hypothetical protein